MARVAKLHNTEPGKYEYEAKNVYRRLRDAHERAVEEYLFKDTITRYDDVIKTQNLRYVGLPHEYALRFHVGMTKARSEEHTSELQSLMRISYAVFCLKKKKQQTTLIIHTSQTT